MPDVEMAVIGWLSAQPALSGVIVSSRVPSNYDGTQRVVRLFRTGGYMDQSLPFSVDHARLDIDCFGPDKGAAHDLMALVRKLVLLDSRSADFSAFSASVHDTLEYVGPQWMDEPDYPNAGRYLIQVGLSLKPA